MSQRAQNENKMDSKQVNQEYHKRAAYKAKILEIRGTHCIFVCREGLNLCVLKKHIKSCI